MHFFDEICSKLGKEVVAGRVEHLLATIHFNILKERGLDTRRVIVDEAAPLYHISGGRCYPPMQIILEEHDMQNRAEQTALLISTLKHFGYPEEKIDYRYMKGCKHTEYKTASMMQPVTSKYLGQITAGRGAADEITGHSSMLSILCQCFAVHPEAVFRSSAYIVL